MEKRGWKEYLKYNLLSLIVLITLIVLGAIIAGNIIVKEGSFDIDNDLNVSGILYVDSTGGTVKVKNDLNMTDNNITSVDCVIFKSRGEICG